MKIRTQVQNVLKSEIHRYYFIDLLAFLSYSVFIFTLGLLRYFSLLWLKLSAALYVALKSTVSHYFCRCVG